MSSYTFAPPAGRYVGPLGIMWVEAAPLVGRRDEDGFWTEAPTTEPWAVMMDLGEDVACVGREATFEAARALCDELEASYADDACGFECFVAY